MSGCVKCSDGSAVIVVGTNGNFCNECFEKYFTHKFRASLGKNPIVRHGERVAVAFSGGINSSTMLRLLLESVKPGTFKRLRFHVGIIFVDETSILPTGDSSDKLAQIEAIMIDSGLPHTTIKLEEALTLNQSDEEGKVDVLPTLDATTNLRSLFESIKTTTGKEELLYRMRCKLLAHKAKEFGYQHVFLGETSSRLAINILSNIAQGRGAHLPIDTGFSDNARYGDIDLLRPLRDISAKEIAVYSTIHKVPTVFFPNFSTMMPSNASIQRLTEDFIVSLSANFPSTETTVYRTSNKLQTSKRPVSSKDSNNDMNHDHCSLCNGPLDTNILHNEARALNAMNFTESLGAGDFGVPDACRFPEFLSHNDHTDDSEGILQSGKSNVKGVELDSILCHGCRVLFKDLNTIGDDDNSEDLLSGLLSPHMIKVSEKDMRNELEGLLIES